MISSECTEGSEEEFYEDYDVRIFVQSGFFSR